MFFQIALFQLETLQSVSQPQHYRLPMLAKGETPSYPGVGQAYSIPIEQQLTSNVLVGKLVSLHEEGTYLQCMKIAASLGNIFKNWMAFFFTFISISVDLD